MFSRGEYYCDKCEMRIAPGDKMVPMEGSHYHDVCCPDNVKTSIYKRERFIVYSNIELPIHVIDCPAPSTQEKPIQVLLCKFCGRLIIGEENVVSFRIETNLKNFQGPELLHYHRECLIENTEGEVFECSDNDRYWFIFVNKNLGAK